MHQILSAIAELSTTAIAIAAGVHIALFALLFFWAKRDMKVLAGMLQDYTRNLSQKSVLDPTAHLTDQIEAFLADVEDVVNDPTRASERELLQTRMTLLDEKRRYLHSLKFETISNMARTMIEAYPLAGVLGTIVSIGAALNAPGVEGAETVSLIVARFGDAIWSTFAGLTAGLTLLFINSLIDPMFVRLSESRSHIRQMISMVKSRIGTARAQSGQTAE